MVATSMRENKSACLRMLDTRSSDTLKSVASELCSARRAASSIGGCAADPLDGSDSAPLLASCGEECGPADGWLGDAVGGGACCERRFFAVTSSPPPDEKSRADAVACSGGDPGGGACIERRFFAAARSDAEEEAAGAALPAPRPAPRGGASAPGAAGRDRDGDGVRSRRRSLSTGRAPAPPDEEGPADTAPPAVGSGGAGAVGSGGWLEAWIKRLFFATASPSHLGISTAAASAPPAGAANPSWSLFFWTLHPLGR